MKLNPTRSFWLGLIGATLGAATMLPLRADDQRERAARQTSPAEAAAKIDLNTASVKALEAAPAIGPELARKIVAARPFTTVDDLNRVPGVTAEQLEQIRAQARVSPAPARTPLGEPTAEKKPLGTPAVERAETRDKVDINAARIETLAAIPAIGPELAREIMAARPFTTLDELSRLRGINAERLEQIRAALTVGTPAKK